MYLILQGEGGTLVAIGADARGFAVLAVRHGDQITLAPVRSTALVPTVVGLIGPMTPGVGRAANLPAETFDTAREATRDGELWSLADRVVEMGIPAKTGRPAYAGASGFAGSGNSAPSFAKTRRCGPGRG